MVTIRVALSDDIYVGDTGTVSIASDVYTQGTASASFSGAIENNSTLAHPQTIAQWAWPGFSIVQSNFDLEVVAFHKSGKNGKPLATVKFVVTDGTTTQTVFATSMTVSDYSGAGNAASNKVLVYKATIPISGFIQGAVLTCNFTAYPWVGDSGATITSATGVTPPSESLCPLLLLCDKNSTYGGGAAVVDSVNGHNSTASTWVAANVASAEATYSGQTPAGADSMSAYTTIGNAAQAIKAYNNTNLSRNEPGGGTILLNSATHIYPGTVPAATLGVQNAWLTIKPLSTVARANAIVSLTGTSQLKGQRTKVEGVSIIGSGAGAMFGGGITTDSLWIDQCAINGTSTNAVFGGWKTNYATRNNVIQISNSNTGNGFVGGAAGSKAPFVLVRGNEGPTASQGKANGLGVLGAFYTMLGNHNLRPQFQATGGATAITDGAIAAFNTHYELSASWISSYADTIITHGNAFVQNIIERTVTEVDWALFMDEDSIPSNHIISWHNIIVGARLGIGFCWNVDVFALRSNYTQVGNIYDEYGHKDDTMVPANAVRTGGWSVGYHVASRGNVRNRFAGTPEWAGEFSGLNTVDLGALGFQDNSSVSGSNTGNGDYHLTPASAGYNLIPSTVSPLPYDIEGTERNLSGGSAGAYEMIFDLPPLTDNGRKHFMTGGF